MWEAKERARRQERQECGSRLSAQNQLNQRFLVWQLKVEVADSAPELASCMLHVCIWEGISGDFWS